MSREEKAFINYWFRHPWEYILPLYPGILLAAAVSNLPLYSLIMSNSVSALFLIGTGFLFAMRNIENPNHAGLSPREHRTRDLLSFLPILSVLLFVVIFHVDLHYALLATILPLLLIYRYRPSDIWRITRHGFALEIIVMIFGIMLFKETMEVSGAVKKLSSVFIGHQIPLLPIICLLPFITGLLTGITVGFVGTSFPILISISGGASLPMVSLAFASGFLGVLLSPVHLCLLLTREYFNADLSGIYRKTLPASGIIFAAALIQYLALT